MCTRNICVDNDEIQKNALRYSHSNNYIFGHQNISFPSKKCDSMHSLQTSFEKKTSFMQFLAYEKFNLQFFHSYNNKTQRKLIDKSNDKKKIIKNFPLLPHTISNQYHSTLKNFKKFNHEKSSIYFTHSTNIKNKSHINYINNEQTKAAVCFILQLNTYIYQKIISLEKNSNSINLQSEKLDLSSKQMIESESSIKAHLNNNIPLIETNDNIDITLELSDNSDTSSKIISNKNHDLLSIMTNTNNELNEKKSLPPLYSRCFVSLEFANQEEHRIEVIELPRSFHRNSRMEIYKKVHERLAVTNLIDIDLTKLFRTVLHAFS